MNDSDFDRPQQQRAKGAAPLGDRVWRTPRLVVADVAAVTEKSPFTTEANSINSGPS
jgi:hypothetical protein